MKHQPYSPDLAPFDFFLFGYVKGKFVRWQISFRASARTFWKVSSNPEREDCWIAWIQMVNMWSKLYILVLECLSNFARRPRVRVNNGHPVYGRTIM
jgi:hypothetical protein